MWETYIEGRIDSIKTGIMISTIFILVLTILFALSAACISADERIDGDSTIAWILTVIAGFLVFMFHLTNTFLPTQEELQRLKKC